MVKKIISVMLATLFATSLVACGRTGGGIDDEEVDETKTQLYISNFDGGFGSQWLYSVKDRFESDYANYKGADGKVGVQIFIDKTKDNANTILDAAAISRDEIFFVENFLYYDAISRGLAMDISDIVTEDIEGEGKSIEDKLTVTQQSYYKYSDGKYYGLPHYESFFGIIYDVDMFEEELLYFADEVDNGNDGFILSLDDDFSTGPDGEYNTYDDGLPSTYAEFYKLCEKMQDLGITPVSWTGQYQDYAARLCSSLHAAYEGEEQMYLNYSLNGTATHLVDSIDDNGNVVLSEPQAITNTNGYLLQKQAGKYYAISFLEKMIDENWYTTSSFSNAQSHTQAQEDFLYGRLSSKKEHIGMLFEGIWWENEADGVFADMSKMYTEAKAGRYSRRLGFMPMPKAPGQALGKTTLIDDLYSGCFIKSNISSEKVEIAKEFVKYCNTDKSLVEFSKLTSTPKALEYEISENDLKDLSYFGRNIFEVRKNANMVYPVSNNLLVNSSLLKFKGVYAWTTNVSGMLYASETIAKTIKNNNIGAKAYFEGLAKNTTKSSWESAYSRFFQY